MIIRSSAYPRASTAAPAAARPYQYHHPRRTRLRGAYTALTNRELEVVDLICDGHSNDSIASQFVISTETVKRHMTNICQKLHVNSRLEVAVTMLKARHAEEMAMVRRECDIFDTQSN
jgi:ATP/maltotriose-dependent transcriptional regulator MalT